MPNCRWLLALFLFADFAHAQEMVMPGMAPAISFPSSGSSLEPGSTAASTNAIHGTLRNWDLMFHANAVLISTQQTGPRGADKVFSTNWFMPMLSREWGRDSLTLRTMLSLEPLTITDRRYPELFQSGETAYGLPIVDGQHPHDLIMELSARYQFRLNDRFRLFIYGGPVAEPALGPPSYPHRASASENPVAVLGHHEEDSTHISDSVITLGLTHRILQLEASTFHGREGNENRWNIDGGKPDSFSSRLTITPNSNLAAQVSAGRIKSRESLDPTVDTIRTTASIHHHAGFHSGHLASSLIWGRNKDLTAPASRVFNAYTFESTANFLSTNWVWTRIENLDRDRSLLIGETPAVLQVEETPIGRMQAYTFGYERDLPLHISALKIGLGAQITGYGLPPVLIAVYGSHPRAVTAFLRLRPSGTPMQSMPMSHGH